MHEIISIQSEEIGTRLDYLLTRRYPDESRTYFQRLIAEGLVLVNGGIAKKSTSLVEGDEIEVQFSLTPELSLEAEPIPLDIIYEDPWLLAVNKPAGLVVHPGAGNWSGTFVNGLLHHCQSLPSFGDHLRPGIVHRLDKDTSGVLLAAKTEEAQQGLVRLFADRRVEKEYIAVCCGKPNASVVEAPIGRDRQDRKRQCISDSGKAALTHLETVATTRELSLVTARPHTGRTHQIRVHLRHVHAPVLGDSLYGWPYWNQKYGAERQLLHAHHLKLIHPITGEPLTLEAPLPQDIQQMVEKIRCEPSFNAYVKPLSK